MVDLAQSCLLTNKPHWKHYLLGRGNEHITINYLMTICHLFMLWLDLQSECTPSEQTMWSNCYNNSIHANAAYTSVQQRVDHTHMNIRWSRQGSELGLRRRALELAVLQPVGLWSDWVLLQAGRCAGRSGHGTNIIRGWHREDDRSGATSLSVDQQHMDGSRVAPEIHLVSLLAILRLREYIQTNII